mgnify:FL=1
MAHPYNTQPPYWRQIDENEFSLAFFQYIFKEPESRQMFYDSKDKKLKESITRVKLFEVSYFDWKGLGVAIAHTREGVRFFKYGNPRKWKVNQSKFAAQFA